jgi:hypothetical protein
MISLAFSPYLLSREKHPQLEFLKMDEKKGERNAYRFNVHLSQYRIPQSLIFLFFPTSFCPVQVRNWVVEIG